MTLFPSFRRIRSAPVALYRLRTLLEYEGQTRLEGAISSTLRSMQSDSAQWATGALGALSFTRDCATRRIRHRNVLCERSYRDRPKGSCQPPAPP
jgi:hypothetical protein